ncbi:hypothetical protein TNCV_1935311 [Trichonephila clavipes]|nr:hypothetical protein TNCV_1935311 [Trichonephila clavipes]
MLTGLSCVQAIPQALHGCKPPLESSCTVVATSSTTVELTLFLPQADCRCKEPISSNFSIIFSRSWAVLGLTPFFNTLECPEVLQSYWCTVIILAKKLYKQSTFPQ